ncbi:MAG: DUF2207 domain-containing protein [Clostridiales bacterium]|nr:DUF2207 domain-containing protein [Clostridiales bacterium]
MNIPSIVICALLSVTTVLLALVPIIIGKIRLRRALRPIEYYPPRGFSPIDVLIEYYGFRANTHALLNPLMLYWADRGFITIEEDCKRGLKLTKLRELEQSSGDKKNFRLDFYDVATERLISKDFDAEKKLFDSIFASGDVFYTLAAKSSHIGVNKEFVASCKENADATKTPLSKKTARMSFIFAVFSVIVATITSAVSAGGGPIFITILFPLIALIGLHFVPSMATESTISFIMYPFFAVWGGAPFGALLAIAPASASVPKSCTGV